MLKLEDEDKEGGLVSSNIEGVRKLCSTMRGGQQGEGGEAKQDSEKP